jgi:hypothetical protein
MTQAVQTILVNRKKYADLDRAVAAAVTLAQRTSELVTVTVSSQELADTIHITVRAQAEGSEV